MQNRTKALNLLGLCERAGKLVSGIDIVLASLKSKKVKVVILANDSHADTCEKVTRAAKQNDVTVIDDFSSDEISHAVGKNRKVLGITDTGFGKALIQKIHKGV